MEEEKKISEPTKKLIGSVRLFPNTNSYTGEELGKDHKEL